MARATISSDRKAPRGGSSPASGRRAGSRSRGRYDDGGVSGGTLDRPALKRLLADIEQGRVDVVVVYKIDRLSRALMDFAKLVEVFDRNNVTFVSVTQSFNTTTSHGPADAEHPAVLRPVRARGHRRAHPRQGRGHRRKRGMWMGGVVPLGYQVRDRKLVINEGKPRPFG